MSTTTQNELMTREMRDSLAARTDVLEKVKHLLLLPGLEMMTSSRWLITSRLTNQSSK